MNIAYIDNQNLYMATRTSASPWDVDMEKLRVYLAKRYDVGEVYLFMGAFTNDARHVYDLFRSFGFILVWRPHGCEFAGRKKGNVDTDVVFSMMRDLHERDDVNKMYLVSGDGDYFRTVNHIMKKGKLGKVLLPSHKNASSLYKKLSYQHYAYLDSERVKSALVRR